MWKYYTSAFPKTERNVGEWLNKIGEEGWEHYGFFGSIFLFKKQEFGHAVEEIEPLMHHGIGSDPPPSVDEK